MTVSSNPRILAAIVMALVLIAAGIGVFFLLGLVAGLIAMAAALFVDWSVLRLLRRQLATRIETKPDMILFTLAGNETVSFPWEKISFAGSVTGADTRGRGRRGAPRLFIYDEPDDRMMSISGEYENVDALEAELRERTDFRDLTLDSDETLKDKLRQLIGQA
jgi:hypothetical protein